MLLQPPFRRLRDEPSSDRGFMEESIMDSSTLVVKTWAGLGKYLETQKS